MLRISASGIIMCEVVLLEFHYPNGRKFSSNEGGIYLTEYRKKNLHPNQIKATVENIELLSVQCFFPETSYNRFKSYIQSSFYVIEQVKDILIVRINEKEE